MNYTIKSSHLSVTVSTRGAELVSIKNGEKEMLWQNENGKWSGHAPILFPVCGACGVRVNGVSYPIEKHGFALFSEFVCELKTENELVFRLTDNEETRRLFPFSFVFRAYYSVSDNVLSVKYEIENPSSDSPLFAATGAHESYMLDAPLSEYKLLFSEEEHFLNFSYDAVRTPDFGYGKVLPCPDSLLQNSESLVLDNINSRSVTLLKNSGEPVVKIDFEGYSNLLLWRPAGAPQMVCIEPWGNLFDPDDTTPENDIEFSEKPNILRVEPQKKVAYNHTITYY